MEGLETNFGLIDWAIVVAYLSGSLLIGVLANKYVHKIQDFIVAGRSLGGFLSFATMTGTELGLVTVMYSSQLGFEHGLSSLHIGLIEGVCLFGIGLSGMIVLPLRKLGVMTIPEFYEKRFGKRVQVLGAIILVVAGVLNMGLFLKAGAIFVTSLTGLTDPIMLNVVMTVMLVLVLVYTSLGGMVSVVLTDYIQFVVLSAAIGAITYFSIQTLGWNEIFEKTYELKGEGGVNPLISEDYGFSYLLWMFLVSFGGGAVWQTSVMRACSLKNPSTVRPLYMATSLSYIVRRSFPAFWGVCAFVYFAGRPEFFGQFAFEGADGTVSTMAGMPLFLGQALPTGLIGIVAAGMLAAFMSTHDSYLLCWSSVLTQDIIAPLKGGLTDRARILYSRFFIVLIGIFLLVWGLWYEAPDTLWNYMAATGTIYFAGAFPVLLGGLYWKRASRTGATLALLAGCLGVLNMIPWPEESFFVTVSLGEGTWWAIQGGRVWSLGAFALSGAMLVLGSLLFPDKQEVAS